MSVAPKIVRAVFIGLEIAIILGIVAAIGAGVLAALGIPALLGFTSTNTFVSFMGLAGFGLGLAAAIGYELTKALEADNNNK